MRLELNFDRAQARLENLPGEYAADPRSIEGADTTFFDPELYDKTDDGRYLLNTGKRNAALQELQSLRLQHENEQLKDASDRRTVIDELRRGLRAAGVNPGLVDAAAALFMTTHQFSIDDTGKVRIHDAHGAVSDSLQAAVRWVERDEHGRLKGRPQSSGQGEFARMIEQLQH